MMKMGRDHISYILDADTRILLGGGTGMSWQIRETYRALRSNIILSMPGEDCKVIGITSAFREDSRSISALNAAISLGELGKEVLVIEENVSSPNLYKDLAVKPFPGLINYLCGDVSFGEVLQCDVLPCVDVLTSGTILQNSAKYLCSNQINTLIDTLKTCYDYIFVILPSLEAMREMKFTPDYIDGYLFVMHEQDEEYKMISDMLRQLDPVHTKIIGFLYNDAIQNGRRGFLSAYQECV